MKADVLLLGLRNKLFVRIKKPTLPEVIPIIDLYIQMEPVGGVCHCSIEDGNHERWIVEAELKDAVRDQKRNCDLLVAWLMNQISWSQKRRMRVPYNRMTSRDTCQAIEDAFTVWLLGKWPVTVMRFEELKGGRF